MMVRVVPVWSALLALVLLATNAPKLFAPQTALMLEAMRSLGPVSGWRCANLATYVYDPRHDTVDTRLLAEAPEAVVAAAYPEVTVERAEVSLRGGDAVLWTTTERGAQYVYVLSPGAAEAIGTPRTRPATCYADQRAWRVVAEHALQ